MRKKVITRVITVLFCLLLVVTLALPCFAYDSNAFYSNAYHSFVSHELTSYMKTDSYQEFIRFYKEINNSEMGGLSRFMEQYVFASGNVLLDGRSNPFGVLGDNFTIYENINFSLVVNGVAYNGYGVIGEASITPILYIRLGDNVEFWGIVNTNNNTIRISSLELNGTTISRSEIQSISLSIGSNMVASGSSSGFVNLVSSILFAMPNYEHVTYPASYYDGYVRGYDSTSYDSGYNEAVNDMSSGEFGRNFLSGIFTAPLNALRSFTLVEWTTSSGALITINLLTVLSAIVGLSLFIWFLKMFAGG